MAVMNFSTCEDSKGTDFGKDIFVSIIYCVQMFQIKNAKVLMDVFHIVCIYILSLETTQTYEPTPMFDKVVAEIASRKWPRTAALKAQSFWATEAS